MFLIYLFFVCACACELLLRFKTRHFISLFKLYYFNLEFKIINDNRNFLEISHPSCKIKKGDR